MIAAFTDSDEGSRTWPVRVDRRNPKLLKVDEDRRREAGEEAQAAGRAEAERVAAEMRGRRQG